MQVCWSSGVIVLAARRKSNTWNFWAWISFVGLLDYWRMDLFSFKSHVQIPVCSFSVCDPYIGIGGGTQWTLLCWRSHAPRVWPASFTVLTFLGKSQKSCFFFLPKPHAMSFGYSCTKKQSWKARGSKWGELRWSPPLGWGQAWDRPISTPVSSEGSERRLWSSIGDNRSHHLLIFNTNSQVLPLDTNLYSEIGFQSLWVGKWSSGLGVSLLSLVGVPSPVLRRRERQMVSAREGAR